MISLLSGRSVTFSCARSVHGVVKRRAPWARHVHGVRGRLPFDGDVCIAPATGQTLDSRPNGAVSVLQQVNTRTACFSRDEAMELQALGHTLTKDTKELGERSRGQKPLLCVVVSRPDRISLDLAKVGHKESFPFICSATPILG
jgi:hypothetical protein